MPAALSALFGLLLAALLGAQAFAAAQILAVRVTNDAGMARVVVEADRPLAFAAFALPEGRPRAVLDIEDLVLGNPPARDIDRGGLVAEVRAGQFSADTVRLVFDLAAPASVTRQFALAPSPEAPHHRIVLDLTLAEPGAPVPAPTLSATAADPAPTRRARPFVVVIDPGHGGRDPGAIGPAGLREKDVVLAVAERLAERLRRSGAYEVVLTRTDDRFIELEDRVRIAREAQADLFVSLHADSNPAGARVRGASVYTLASRAEGRSRSEVLAEQPWLIDVALEDKPPEVSSILVELAQRATRSNSDLLAAELIEEIAKITPVLSNTHRRAGFFVLLSPDVPSVLVEMGFLSNAQDEAALATDRRRDELAIALHRGVEDYFAAKRAAGHAD